MGGRAGVQRFGQAGCRSPACRHGTSIDNRTETPAIPWQCHGCAPGMACKVTSPLLAHQDDLKDRSARFVNECRSEEHKSEIQSLMRITSAVYCLKKTNKDKQQYQ